MKVSKLKSRNIDYMSYVFQGQISELVFTLYTEGLKPIKYVYEGKKGKLRFAIEISTGKVWVLAKKGELIFQAFPSDIVVTPTGMSNEEKRIALRQAVASAYSKWIYDDLQFAVTLGGGSYMTPDECWWF